MLKQTGLILTLTAAVTAGALAQAPAPARPAQTPSTPRPSAAQPRPAGEEPQAERPAPARPVEPAGQPVNIKLDITITDQVTSGEPSRKTVSMLIADRSAGSIRTGGIQMPTTSGPTALNINVDAVPTIQRDGSIRLQFGLEYQPRPGADPAQPTAAPSRMSQVNERLVVILQDGKPLVISQAADAGSDRKVVVELRASIMK